MWRIKLWFVTPLYFDSKTLRQFLSHCWEIKSAWIHRSSVHVNSISQQSDQSWRSVTLQLRRDKSRNEGQLRLPVTGPHLSYILWTLWTWGFTSYHLMFTIFKKKHKKRRPQLGQNNRISSDDKVCPKNIGTSHRFKKRTSTIASCVCVHACVRACVRARVTLFAI